MKKYPQGEYYENEIFGILIDSYCSLSRKYHDLLHIKECLEELDDVKKLNLLENPLAIEFALWFHDLIYLPYSNHNEKLSSEIAGHYASLIYPDNYEFNNLIKQLIIVTKHTGNTSLSNDEKYITDIDLVRLSAPNFADFSSQIHYEYSMRPDKEFWTGRKQVLEHFRLRQRIYQTDYYFDKYESAARKNIETGIRECDQILSGYIESL